MNTLTKEKIDEWMRNVIKPEEDEKYLNNGLDFINDEEIETLIKEKKNPDKQRIRAIIDKALAIETLSPEEVAYLINLKDEDLWQEIYEAAGKIKKKVYDNRIVFFAPLYLSNYCVNSCVYCGFRVENKHEVRKILSKEEIINETKALVNIGHKRLIVVYGEHPLSDIDYIVDSIRTIYSVKEGRGQIRRVNVNSAPFDKANLKRLKDVGIGTYQVFQETYHHKTYKKLHPRGIKADYKWRLYVLHRAQEVGIDDVAIGALFGLYDWRFEVMGLLYHAIDLEKHFGIGPHTVSFPRLEPAANTPFIEKTPYKVSDADFKKIIAILRLAIPYAGMILTAREPAEIRNEIIPIGITQIDASSKIAIGSYSEGKNIQYADRQQFLLGDTRTLEEMVYYLAKNGMITSFCTAGYRCGRTGDKIMKLLKTGQEGQFCKLNAVLTFREYLDDYATEETKKVGYELIKKEYEEIRDTNPRYFNLFDKYLKRIEKGERDLYL